MHLTFKQYLESQGKSKSTVIAYSRYALDFISYLDADNTVVENATAKEVLSYLSHLQKKGQENIRANINLLAFFVINKILIKLLKKIDYGRTKL